MPLQFLIMGLNIGLWQGAKVALDLGNSNTVISNKSHLLSQPSWIVLNKNNQSVKAAGEAAYDILGKGNDQMEAIKPLRGGIITHYDAASKMLNALIKHAYPKKSFFGGFAHLVSGVPFSSNEVEKRALRDVLKQLKAGKTSLIYEPIAAAIGLGLNVQEPNGKFIIDIGGGITEISLISHSNIVAHRAIRVGGDAFDDQIRDYLFSQHNLSVDIKRAESIKIAIATASIEARPETTFLEVKGTDLTSREPRAVTIEHAEIVKVLDDGIVQIEEAIMETLEASPPELSADVYTNGIHLTGGGALLKGMRERLEAKVGVPVFQDSKAFTAVAEGILQVLESPRLSQAVLFS